MRTQVTLGKNESGGIYFKMVEFLGQQFTIVIAGEYV
jgi:hypothetical protein